MCHLFSKAYRPLAQQYFSAGLVWSLPWGGVLFHYHFGGGPLPPTTSGGGPLPPPLLGGGGGGSSSYHFQGVLFHYHFWGGGGVLFHHHFGGSHVTYPIMLLYTTIECPSASWAKFTWDPPRVGQTDRQTCVKTLPFPHTTYAGGNN